MKESKKIDKLNEKIDKETEKRFNEELNEIKEKLNSEKLSDEFKLNLQRKMEEELNKTEEPSKGKIYKFPTFTRKLAGICACFIFLFLGCFTYADDIENVILELFGTTDKVIAKAIEEGNYKEIDMDYVEDNGVSIKVDYVAIEDNDIYIAFNILCDEEFDKILLGNKAIYKNGNEALYIEMNKKNNPILTTQDLLISKENLILTYKLKKVKADLKDIEYITIEIDDLYMISSMENNKKVGNWNFKIDI